ncbi:MAG: hypothetical protein JWO44_1593 [Bacteroidetes bacterium]|jgi:hypothetical protein|nr:hypothetical protein [Bacteroidota bacterium]
MKTIRTFIAGAAIFLSAQSFAQTAAASAKPNSAQEITFSTQAEKDAKIKQLEEKLKVDMIDATYPKADLEKEKQTLAKTRKARIVAVVNK